MEKKSTIKSYIKAIEIIRDTNQTFFLTGKAGTGKSSLLLNIIKSIPKAFVVVAPTGISAINIKGETIHSFFSFPLRPLMPNDKEIKKFSIGSEKRNLIEKMQTLIIDEISMVRADIIDAIDYSLRINGGDLNLPFGGKQVVFVGDVFQLEPIARDDNGEKKIITEIYGGTYFFKAKVFKILQLQALELDNNYRQSDSNFRVILDKIRNKEISKLDISEINKVLYNPHKKNDKTFAITLTSTNLLANQLNQKLLKDLNSKEFSYEATVTGIFENSKYPTDYNLNLKVGAQIIFLKNSTNWVNGTIAIIVDLSVDSITVKLEDSIELKLVKDIWENFSYSYNPILNKIESVVIGQFMQYPIKLAWSITIHKSQGLTFEKVIVDFGKRTFASGQAYVALSRAKTIKNLTLQREILASDIIISEEIIEFSKSLNYIDSEVKELQRYFPLVSRQSKYIIKTLSRFYEFDDFLLMKYKDILDWTEVSINKSLNFTENELLIKYINYVDWHEISYRRDISWDMKSVKKFQHKIKWNRFLYNKNLPWSEEFITTFDHLLDWDAVSYYIPWNEYFIEKYFGKLNWKSLSTREDLPWSVEFIDLFRDKWEWNYLTRNNNTPWSIEILKKFEDLWDWKVISSIDLGIWTEELIVLFIDKWDFDRLSNNRHLPWSENLIDHYKNEWNWHSIAFNYGIEWDEELIYKYDNKLCMKCFSQNKTFIWTENFISKNKEKLSWDNISDNDSIIWTTDFINKYHDKLNWNSSRGIRSNKAFPWSMEFIKKYNHKFNGYEYLIQNPNIEWSLEMLLENEYKIIWKWMYTYKHIYNQLFSQLNNYEIDYLLEIAKK